MYFRCEVDDESAQVPFQVLVGLAEKRFQHPQLRPGIEKVTTSSLSRLRAGIRTFQVWLLQQFFLLQYAPNCLEHRKCIKMDLKCPTIVLNCLHILDYIFMVDLKSKNLHMGTHTQGTKFIVFQNARIQTIFEDVKKT